MKAVNKFNIGQRLKLSPSRWSMRAQARSMQCKIVRVLPADEAGERLYRVQCTDEPFERNVRESELLEADLT